MVWVVLGVPIVWVVWYAVTLQMERRCTGDGLAFALVRRTSRVFCRLWLGLCPNRRDPLPATGAAIVISNHTCSADPFLLTVATRRLISFMMASEYFELPILPTLFRIVQVITVHRDGHDLAGIKATLCALKDGRVVGMFPEGKINMARSGLLPPKLGAAMLALDTDVPVVPAYIDGTPRGAGMAEGFLRFGGRVRIRYGPPLDLRAYRDQPRTRELLQAVADHMMRAIAALGPPPT